MEKLLQLHKSKRLISFPKNVTKEGNPRFYTVSVIFEQLSFKAEVKNFQSDIYQGLYKILSAESLRKLVKASYFCILK